MNTETLKPSGTSRRMPWILGALSAFLLVGGIYALIAAIKAARIDVLLEEQSKLASALQSYKEKFGAFPPSNDPDDIRRHFRIAYPRYQGDAIADLQKLRLDPAKLDAREALVLWLGGLPPPDNLPKDFRDLPPEFHPPTKKLIGFYMDVLDPIAGGDPIMRNQSKYRTSPFYDFVESRLTDTDGDRWLEYRAKHWDDDPIWFEYDPQKHAVVPSRDPEE